MEQYRMAGECYWATLATIAFYTDGEYRKLLAQAVEWLQPDTVYSDAFQFKQYPSLLSMYAIGVSSVAGSNFQNVAAVLFDPVFIDTFRITRHVALERTNISAGMSSLVNFLYGNSTRGFLMQDMEGQKRFNADVSKSVRSLVTHVIQRESDYIFAYEVFELLLAITYMDKIEPTWSPIGSYYWRYFSGYGVAQWEQTPLCKFLADHIRLGDASPIVQAGLGGGSGARFNELVVAQVTFLRDKKAH